MTRARDTADLLTFAPTAQGAETVVPTPLIINGDMRITQRMDSDTTRNGLNIDVSGYFTHDRWTLDMNNSGAVDTTKDTDVPEGAGFKHSLKIKCRTADASLAAADRLGWRQIIEDQYCVITRKGHSDAKKMTLAFWVRGKQTGTYIAELFDLQNTRHCAQAYTINTADTWEKKVLVFPADTTGKFDNDNGQGFMVNFWLAAGSDFTSGSLQTSFGSSADTNRAVGQTNLQASTDNTWYLTGVQLEVGEYTATTIPPFQHMNIAAELMRCFRYFEAHAGGHDKLIGLGGMYTGSQYDVTLNTITEKRATPTMIVKDATNHFQIRVDNEVKTGDTIDVLGSRSHSRKVHLQINATSIPAGISQGFNGLLATNNAASYVQISSEL